MKQIGLCILVAALTHGICVAGTTNASTVDEKIAHDLAQYHELHTVTNLPPSVFKLCADFNGRLANPGQKWEMTDVITDERLPRHRMIWAVTDGNSYIVHYECGGYAHSFKVLIVEVKLGKVDPGRIQNGWVERPFKDFKNFLEFNHKKK